MINPGRSYNINDYKEIFLRRKLYFVIPFVVIFTAPVLWAAVAPRKYQASTLVLVTPQRVPTELVRPTVTAGILERLNSISQEIMSRTRLEQIMDELKLYQDESKSMKREEVVESDAQEHQGGAPQAHVGDRRILRHQLHGEDPRIVTAVANKLSSLFIEENLKQREQQAVGTTEFLASELDATKEKLETQGQILADYKRRNMGSLPEQRDTNIKMLEQLQLLYQRNEESLRALEDRKLLIRKQMADVVTTRPSGWALTGQPSRRRGRSYEAQLEELKKQLAELQSRYTERHPDIVRTRKRIADMEKRREDPDVKNDPVPGVGKSLAALDRRSEPPGRKREASRGQLAQYRGSIEGATVREQEMSSIVQEIQQNETCLRLAPEEERGGPAGGKSGTASEGRAVPGHRPGPGPRETLSSRISRKCFSSACWGIACGLGGIFVREQLDRSFRDPEDVEATLGFKVLANIPKIISKAS